MDLAGAVLYLGINPVKRLYQGPVLVWIWPPDRCSIDGCGNKRHCRGWCKKHYSRWQRHADPTTTKPSNEFKPGQWRQRLRQRIGPPLANGCREYLGGWSSQGYPGPISVDGIKMQAHRAVWLAERGEIPPDHFVIHTCRWSPCVEISHLRLVDWDGFKAFHYGR